MKKFLTTILWLAIVAFISIWLSSVAQTPSTTTFDIEKLRINTGYCKLQNSRGTIEFPNDRKYLNRQSWGGVVVTTDSTLAGRRYSVTPLSDRKGLIKSDVSNDNSTVFYIAVSIPDSVLRTGRLR